MATKKTDAPKAATAAPKAVKPLTLIVGAALIEKAITSIHKAGAKLDTSIQQAALSVIQHVDTCGDTTLADRLFNAMPKGSRRNALAEWLVTFGKMRVLLASNKEDALALKAGRVFQFEKTRKTDMLGGTAKAWHECKKEADVSTTFDVQEAFASLMARIKKAQDNKLTIEHPELIEKLSKLMA